MTQTLTTKALRALRDSLKSWQDGYDPVDDKEQYEMFVTAETAVGELLANREAQPVAWTSQRALETKCKITAFTDDMSALEYGVTHGWKDIVELFTAPPVVNTEFTGATAVPDFGALTKLIVGRLIDCGAAGDDSIADAETFVYNACRAAMLAQPVSQGCNWIACSEKMPEPNKYVQVSNGVWVGIGMYNDAEHFEDDERWQDEHNEFIDLLHHPVTHWMPLPAAPEVTPITDKRQSMAEQMEMGARLTNHRFNVNGGA